MHLNVYLLVYSSICLGLQASISNAWHMQLCNKKSMFSVNNWKIYKTST